MKKCISRRTESQLSRWHTSCGRILLLTIFIAFSTHSFSYGQQKAIITLDGSKFLKEVCSLPKHIKEASGLELTIQGSLWTHNDGGIPMLFNIDTTGHVIQSLQLNHPNHGWESLALDDDGNLYVGAFGNNKNDKKDLKVYKIPSPDSITEKVITAGIIRFKYKDQKRFPPPPSQQNFDADAFTFFNDSLYLFTKNRTNPFDGYTKIYTLPTEPGQYEIESRDSIFLGLGPMIEYWITAADISPDKNVIALLSHSHLWIVTDFKNKKISQGKITRINFNHFSHKAGLCFVTNNLLYIVDELEFGLIGGKLYSLDLYEINHHPQ